MTLAWDCLLMKLVQTVQTLLECGGEDSSNVCSAQRDLETSFDNLRFVWNESLCLLMIFSSQDYFDVVPSRSSSCSTCSLTSIFSFISPHTTCSRLQSQRLSHKLSLSPISNSITSQTKVRRVSNLLDKAITSNWIKRERRWKKSSNPTGEA